MSHPLRLSHLPGDCRRAIPCLVAHNTCEPVCATRPNLRGDLRRHNPPLKLLSLTIIPCWCHTRLLRTPEGLRQQSHAPRSSRRKVRRVLFDDAGARARTQKVIKTCTHTHIHIHSIRSRGLSDVMKPKQKKKRKKKENWQSVFLIFRAAADTQCCWCLLSQRAPLSTGNAVCQFSVRDSR